MIDQLQIALDAQRRVFIDGMKRREEDSVLEFDGHGRVLRIIWRPYAIGVGASPRFRHVK